MLRTVHVTLKGQPLARVDNDALDLEAGSIGDRFVGAPRPGNLGWRYHQILLLAFQLFDNLLHVRDPIERRDQHGIAHGDHRDVVEPERCNEWAAIAAKERIAGIDDRDVTLADIAILVVSGKLPYRIPRADVGPLHLNRYDNAA